MKINIKEKIIFVLCYLFALILLFKDGLRKGMFLSGYDIDTLSLPFRIFAKSTFDTYKSMPVWLPGILNGIPLIDSSNIEYFYPLNFIYMMLPIHPAYTYTFDIIIHLFIAGTGTYCFLRALRLHPFSCFFGGFIFMTSCMLVSFVNSGIMGIIKAVSFIPFVFYFIKRGIDGGRFISFLNISVLFAMQILCLGIQITFYTILAGGIYFIFELIQENSKKRSDKIIYFVAACCLTIFLGALQLFPTAEYFRYSWRSGADDQIFNYGFFEPIQLVSFIFPHFFSDNYAKIAVGSPYMGIIPLVFLLFAFSDKNVRYQTFFLCLSVIFLILSMGTNVPFLKNFFNFPLLSSFRLHIRFLYLTVFFVSIIAAFGFDNFMNGRIAIKNRKIISLILLSVFCIALFYVTGFLQKAIQLFIINNKINLDLNILNNNKLMLLQDFVFLSAVIFSLLFLIFKPKNVLQNIFPFVLILIFFHFLDVARVNKEFITYKNYDAFIAEKKDVYDLIKQDKSIYRITYDYGMINHNLYYDTESIKGYHGMLPKSFFEMNAVGLYKYIDIYRIYNTKYHITEAELNGSGMEKIFDNDKDIKIYRDNFYLPRFYFAKRIIISDAEDLFISMIKNKTFEPGDAIIASKDFKKLNGIDDGIIDVISYKPHSIILATSSQKDTFLVISNFYYHRWKLKIDDEPSQIYKTNYNMWGVYVPPGKHRLFFNYDFSYIYQALYMTLTGILIYIIIWIVWLINHLKSLRKS